MNDRTTTVELQLYMWEGTRNDLLERHDFYVSEAKSRVIANFANIEEDTDRFAAKENKRLASLVADENSDQSELAEAVKDSAYNFYFMLSELKKQMIVGILAGCFHQWDKDLRNFLQKELEHNFRTDHATEIVWPPNLDNIFSILEQFGWDCRNLSFYSSIDACRLIVNVYKHGRGRSLDELYKCYPVYLRNPTLSEPKRPWNKRVELEYEWLEVSEAQFDQFASSFRLFWEHFPERLYLQVPMQKL